MSPALPIRGGRTMPDMLVRSSVTLRAVDHVIGRVRSKMSKGVDFCHGRLDDGIYSGFTYEADYAVRTNRGPELYDPFKDYWEGEGEADRRFVAIEIVVPFALSRDATRRITARLQERTDIVKAESFDLHVEGRNRRAWLLIVMPAEEFNVLAA